MSACAAALVAALSFGPQKYFDARFDQTWPAVITGQIAIVAILFYVTQNRRNRSVE